MSSVACPNCGAPNAEFNPRCTSCGAALPELSGISETESRPAPAVSPTQDSLLGQSLSHYQVHERLGAGGMGEVYRATDTLLRRSVALKLLSPKLAGDPQAKARFVREAQAASALDHPNIGTIHEIGEHQGRLFIAMALVDGETLQQRIASGPLEIAEAAGILAQVATGLAAAHAAGIVHRDLKPANMMITRSGCVKILDFGLAKLLDEAEGSETPLTESGQPLGTVAYMSPEQARGEPLDQRTDLWSLGVMAYEMLTGVRPFDADSKVGTLTRIATEEPVALAELRTGVPEHVQDLVSSLLRKQPQDRVQSAGDVIQWLEGPSGRVVGPVRTRPARRSYGLVAAITVLVLAGLGTGLWLRQTLGIEKPPAARTARMQASLPSSPEAARLYAEGLAKLRVCDGAAAVRLLEKAVAEAPDFALARAALVEAWDWYGYKEKVVAEADKALALSKNLLPEERLEVQAACDAFASWKFDEALQSYRTLFESHPENLEHGVHVMILQAFLGLWEDMLATAESLRRLPLPLREDPRIDLWEANALQGLGRSDAALRMAAKAAAKAQERDAPVILGLAKGCQAEAFLALGEVDQGIAAAREAKAIYVATEDHGDLTYLYDTLIEALVGKGDLAAARQMAEEKLAHDAQMGDRMVLACGLLHVGSILGDREEAGWAQPKFEEALDLYRQAADRRGEGMALSNIGEMLRNSGDLPASQRRYEEAAAVFRAIKLGAHIQWTLASLSEVLARQGRLGDARKLTEESVALSRSLGTERVTARLWRTGLAAQLSMGGKLFKARKLYEEMLPASREGKDIGWEADVLRGLSRALLAEGDVDGARQRMAEALSLRQEQSVLPSILEARAALAAIALEEGRLDEAAATARELAAQCRSRRKIDTEAAVLDVEARALLAQGKVAEARAALDGAQKLADDSGDLSIRLSVAVTGARVRAASGKPADAAAAIRSLEAVVTEAHKAEFLQEELEARLALGEVEMRSGKTEAGRARLAALEREAAAKGFGLVARKAAAR